MYDFWYDYVKPKHGENEKYVTQTHRIIIHIKTENIYIDITKIVKTLLKML